jgi:uncharacterized DUF497 family protein
MRLEWDARKARANLRKHGVTFEEASSVFFDPLSVTGDDPDHSVGERRLVTFGVFLWETSRGGHAEAGDAIRIISARRTTRAERKLYEEG